MFSVGDLREVLSSHSRGKSIKSPIALIMPYIHRVFHSEGVVFREFGFLVLKLFIVGI